MKHIIDIQLLLLLLCFVANAEAPCSVCPAMSIDQGPLIENGIAQIHGIKSHLFNCTADGIAIHVAAMKLNCSWANNSVESYDTFVSKEYKVVPQIHLKKCECEAFTSDGKTEKTEITIDLITQPELVDEDGDYDRHFYMTEGESFDFDLPVWANPPVNSFFFTVTFRVIDYVNATSRVVPDQPILNLVRLYIEKLDLNMTGGYHVDIKNGVGSRILYDFFINVSAIVRPKPETDKGFGFYQLVAGLAILLALLILALVGVMCSGVCKRKKSQPEEIKYSLSYETVEAPITEEEENMIDTGKRTTRTTEAEKIPHEHEHEHEDEDQPKSEIYQTEI